MKDYYEIVANLPDKEKARLNKLAIKVLGLRVIDRKVSADKYGFGDIAMIGGASIALYAMEQEAFKKKKPKPRKKK